MIILKKEELKSLLRRLDNHGSSWLIFKSKIFRGMLFYHPNGKETDFEFTTRYFSEELYKEARREVSEYFEFG